MTPSRFTSKWKVHVKLRTVLLIICPGNAVIRIFIIRAHLLIRFKSTVGVLMFWWIQTAVFYIDIQFMGLNIIKYYILSPYILIISDYLSPIATVITDQLTKVFKKMRKSHEAEMANLESRKISISLVLWSWKWYISYIVEESVLSN